jgi:hypothetical protein
VQALCLLQISNTLVDIHSNSNMLKFYLNINYKSKTSTRLNPPNPEILTPTAQTKPQPRNPNLNRTRLKK